MRGLLGRVQLDIFCPGNFYTEREWTNDVWIWRANVKRALFKTENSLLAPNDVIRRYLLELIQYSVFCIIYLFEHNNANIRNIHRKLSVTIKLFSAEEVVLNI